MATAQQESPLVYNPISGKRLVEDKPIRADKFRFLTAESAWHFNPWTGRQRDLDDVKSDPLGLAIIPPGERIIPAPFVTAEEDAAFADLTAGPIPGDVDPSLREHPLFEPLMDAIRQATKGKGQRHGGDSIPFMRQQWVALAMCHGLGGLTFQASKKLNEAAAAREAGLRAGKFDHMAFEREVLCAIVYAGMALIHHRMAMPPRLIPEPFVSSPASPPQAQTTS